MEGIINLPDAFLETDLELSEDRCPVWWSELLKFGGKKNNLLAGRERFLGEGEADWLV